MNNNKSRNLSTATLTEATKELQAIHLEINATKSKLNNLEKESFYWTGIVDYLRDKEYAEQESLKTGLKQQNGTEPSIDKK